MPDFCPLIERKFTRVQAQILADPALKESVRLVSVTIDPENDTPAVLAKHREALGADPDVWEFLTGPLADVDGFAAQFGVSVMRDDPKDLLHNLRTAVIDPQGRLSTVLGGGEWTPEDLVAALRTARAAR